MSANEPATAAKPLHPNGPATLRTVRVAVLAVSLPFGILHFVLPIYGRDLGASGLQIGLFFSAFSIMTVLLRPLVGSAVDRFGRRPFFVSRLAGYGLAMFAFALSDDVWAVVLAWTLQGIASSFLWLAADAITADSAQVGERGRSFGGVARRA